MNYVYVYKLGSIPIYVGIGEEDDDKFKRAHDLKRHESIKADERKRVTIEIVARNLSRNEARRTEMTLVQILGSVHVLRNVVQTYAGAKLKVVQASESKEERVRYLLKTQREEIRDTCLEIYSRLDVAEHIVYIESGITKTARQALKTIMPRYDPHVDALLEKTRSWLKARKFDASDYGALMNPGKRVMFVVLNSKHATALNKIGYRDNVHFGSLEQWVHGTVIHPEGRKDVRHIRKRRPLNDNWKERVEVWE